MAKLWWGVCDTCGWIGNAYPDAKKANDELTEHSRHHASKNEDASGRLESSDAETTAAD